MPAIKKTVRLLEPTIKLCYEMTSHSLTEFDEEPTTEHINFSGSLNSMSKQLKILFDDSLPELSENEKNAIRCAYNGRVQQQDIEEEIRILPWNISEAYEHDENLTDFLQTKDQAEFLIERAKEWSKSERLAVIYMATSYWKKPLNFENIK